MNYQKVLDPIQEHKRKRLVNTCLDCINEIRNNQIYIYLKKN